MRRSTILMGLLTCIIGAGLFQLKYEVMSLESQYRNICHSIRAGEESISVLKAEWTHLTNLPRLERLAQKHLSFEQLSQKQMVSFRRLSPLSESMSEQGRLQEISVSSEEEADIDSLLSELSQEASQ